VDQQERRLDAGEVLSCKLTDCRRASMNSGDQVCARWVPED
jgi:hypothetical protein